MGAALSCGARSSDAEAAGCPCENNIEIRQKKEQIKWVEFLEWHQRKIV